MVNEPVVEQHPTNLIRMAENIDITRSSCIRYLEQFRSCFKAILYAGQFALLDNLEHGWHLEQLERDIVEKLSSLEKVLVTTEHSISSYKQDRLGNIAFVFTVITLASVMAALVALSPLKERFHENHPMVFFSNELFFVMLSTGGIIALTIYLVMKSYGMRRKLFKRAQKLSKTLSSLDVKRRYTRKIKDTYSLYEEDKRLAAFRSDKTRN